MRTLILLRGISGSGKSTFVKQQGLENYTLSADTNRVMLEGPILTVDGTCRVSKSRSSNTMAWKILFEALESRMKIGAFTVVDATHLEHNSFHEYKKLAEKYRYRVFCIDFTDISNEELLSRNKTRESLKRVPDSAIDKQLNKLHNSTVPNWISILKPENFKDAFIQPVDLSNYKKIHHIGDVHGCNTVLQEYLSQNGGIKEDEFYIFLGDYIDRGLENEDVLNFLLKIYTLPNVGLIEGNHEKWIRKWANNEKVHSTTFANITAPELEAANISLKDIRQLCRRLRQCMYYTYDEKTVIVTHGGLSTLPDNLTLVPTSQMIDGVGGYGDMMVCNESFMNSTPYNVYQVHGHRNIEMVDTKINEWCFNLNDKVEFGGFLRCLQLTKEGFNPVLTQNKVFKVVEQPKPIEEMTIEEVIAELRNNELIKETQFDNISSFNFTRDAFNDRKWNEQTTKARGLYIDLDRNKIAARSYDKFFNLDEVTETKFKSLKSNLVFPITAYVKENGYLGIVSYDETKNNLLITTKSSIDGDYAQWFRAQIEKHFSLGLRDLIKDICRKNEVSFIFEVIDVVNDPHIIEYKDSHMVLLDIVSNSMSFKKVSYDELLQASCFMGIRKVKAKAIELNNWEEFMTWYRQVMRSDYVLNEREGSYIEGFVIEDSSGFMFKIKLKYYNFWKFMRKVAESVNKRGVISKEYLLSSPEAMDFYRWLQELYNSGVTFNPQNICELRKAFLQREIKANNNNVKGF